MGSCGLEALISVRNDPAVDHAYDVMPVDEGGRQLDDALRVIFGDADVSIERVWAARIGFVYAAMRVIGEVSPNWRCGPGACWDCTDTDFGARGLCVKCGGADRRFNR